MSGAFHPASSLPLSGRRVLLTRPDDERNEAFIVELGAMGAEVRHWPLIEVHPLSVGWPEPEAFDWVFFTSPNAVHSLVSSADFAPDRWERVAIAAVGPTTERALLAVGLPVRFVAPLHEAEDAARTFAEVHANPNLRVFWPCGNLAAPRLKTVLESHGVSVTAQVVYETIARTGWRDSDRAFLSPLPDLLIFTSSSAVQTFYLLQLQSGIPLPDVPVACLGPRTAQTAIELLGHVEVQAEPYTLTGLRQAIQAYFTGMENP